jgi:hypothetical protein
LFYEAATDAAVRACDEYNFVLDVESEHLRSLR